MSPAPAPGPVIAHRGASAECPENTLAAFDRAVELGADGIELDLRPSRDGVPVVFHDPTLSRVGGGPRRIAELTLEQLRAVDVGSWFGSRFSGQRIPTLDDVLETYGRRTRLLLELKVDDPSPVVDRLVHAVATRLGRHALGNRVTLLCFDRDVLARLARTAPGTPCALNMRPPRWPTRRGLDSLRDLDAVSSDVRGLGARFGGMLRDAGLPLLVFTCNTEDQVDRARRAGAAGIMSDDPSWLGRILRSSAGDRA